MHSSPERNDDAHALARAKATLRRVSRDAVHVDDRQALGPRSAGTLADEILRIRDATAASPVTGLRRLLFVWFRVYVRETRGTKVELTNVRIPVPIPLLGLLLPRRLDAAKAARIIDPIRRPADGGAGGSAEAHLASNMAFELVRHATHDPDRNRSEYVVIGFD